jgi:hypothetical protein
VTFHFSGEDWIILLTGQVLSIQFPKRNSDRRPPLLYSYLIGIFSTDFMVQACFFSSSGGGEGIGCEGDP